MKYGKKLILILIAWVTLMGASHGLKADGNTVVISEIAWMGSSSSSNDEWIELYNNSDVPVDLSGWHLKEAAEGFDVALAGILEPHVFFLLERTDDTTVPEVTANQIYTGALKNNDVTLQLIDASGVVVEQISSWYGGNNTSKATMERFKNELSSDTAENWCTSVTPKGTPGAMNDCPSEPIQVPPQEESSGESESIIERVINQTFKADDIVFIAVVPNPEGKDAGNEKIILKNNRMDTVDLGGWSLIDDKGKKVFLPSKSILPEEEVTFSTAGLSLTLKNTAGKLLLIDPNGFEIDFITWDNASSGQKVIQTKAYIKGVRGVVTEVIDGDTFKAKIADKEVSIRLLGVDTPETVNPKKPMEWYGKNASNFLKTKLTGQEVEFDFENKKMDKYGRILAYIYLNGESVNETLIREGYGYAYTRFPFRDLERYKTLEKEAQAAHKGLWENRTVEILVGLEKEISKRDFEYLEEAQIPEEKPIVVTMSKPPKKTAVKPKATKAKPAKKVTTKKASTTYTSSPLDMEMVKSLMEMNHTLSPAQTTEAPTSKWVWIGVVLALMINGLEVVVLAKLLKHIKMGESG